MVDSNKKLGISLILTPLQFITHGYVFSKLWEWFVEATFKLPHLNLWESIGILVLVGFATEKINWSSKMENTEADKFASKFIDHALIMPIATLIFAYVIKLFV